MAANHLASVVCRKWLCMDCMAVSLQIRPVGLSFLDPSHGQAPRSSSSEIGCSDLKDWGWYYGIQLCDSLGTWKMRFVYAMPILLWNLATNTMPVGFEFACAYKHAWLRSCTRYTCFCCIKHNLHIWCMEWSWHFRFLEDRNGTHCRAAAQNHAIKGGLI